MRKTADKGVAGAAGINRADFKRRDVNVPIARHP